MSLEPIDESSAPTHADDVLAALAAEPRRDTLRYFLETTERTATLDELASYVAGRVGGLSDDAREDTRLHLHHVHLPKLADVGLVDYDIQSSTVRYREHPFAERIVEWSG
jgi:hypothetical protein